MCGIVGIAGRLDEHAEDDVAFGLERLRHRGPDFQQAKRIHSQVIFGHTRLSIIDLNIRAHQPMQHVESGSWLTYNGEVYNFKTIRSELEALGHRFHTTSDTEVVLASLVEWKEDALKRFNGMFALAFWDASSGDLLLARDRFGQKPLYYAALGDQLRFASEAGAIVDAPSQRGKHSPSIAALNSFFALGYILHPLSIYENVSKLAPGCWLRRAGNGELQHGRYWNYREYIDRKAGGDASAMARELAEHIESAVQLRTIADVSVGAFLSGGLDSSTIVSVLRGTSDEQPQTFSAGFEEESYDESAEAEEFAQWAGTRHHAVRVGGSDIPQLVDAAIAAYDEPFADTSLVPMYAVAAHAAEHVRVVLSGDAADGLFAGYVTYDADAIKRGLDVIPLALQRILASPLKGLTPRGSAQVGWRFKAGQFARGLGVDWRYAHYAWRELFDEQERIELIGPDFAAEVKHSHPFELFRDHYRVVEGLDRLSQHLYVDAQTFLTDDVLVKVDRATMAHSLEARAPFLDHKLVEFAARVPTRCTRRLGQGKLLLRSAMKGRLPETTRTRRKSGFNAPIRSWFKNGEGNEFQQFTKYVWMKHWKEKLGL